MGNSPGAIALDQTEILPVRRTLALLLALVAPLAVAADGDGPTVTEAVVATDVCGDVTETGEAVLAAHDVCDVTFRTTTMSGEAPRLEVVLRVAGDADGQDALSAIEWEGETCRYRLLRETYEQLGVPGIATVGSAETLRLVANCDDPRPCTYYVLGMPTVEIPFSDCSWENHYLEGAAVDGDTVTVDLTFEGELAAYADDLAPGAVLTPTRVGVGPATAGRLAGTRTVAVCPDGCRDAVYDHAEFLTPFTVG